MDCRQCQEQLGSRHDHELDASLAAAVDAHVARCATCREEVAHLEAVSALFQPLRGEAAPARLWPSIEALVRSTGKRTANRFRRMWVPRAAAACVGAILVLSGALFMEPAFQGARRQETAVHQPAPSADDDRLGGLLGSVRAGVTSEAEFLKETQAVGRRVESRLLAAVLAAGR